MKYFVAALDLGGSEIRGIYNTNNEEVMKESSDYKEIGVGAQVIADTPDPLDDFVIKKSQAKDLAGRRFVKRGAFAAHTGGTQRADNQTKKHLQEATYINGIHALAKNMVKAQRVPSGSDNSIKCATGIAIPASEFYTEGAPDIVKESFAGTTEVYFPVLNKVVRFTIKKSDVVIMPEGIIGLYRLISGEYKQVLKNGRGILVDPGRLTTEIVLIHKFVSNSGTAMSYPQAGSVLESLISNRLIRADLPNTYEDVMQAIESGNVQVGKNTISVGYMVQEAKRSLSKLTVENIIEVINSQGTRLANYEYIVPMGRCFNVNGIEGDASFTGDLLEYILKDLNANLGVVHTDTNDEANVRGVSDVLRQKYSQSA